MRADGRIVAVIAAVPLPPLPVPVLPAPSGTRPVVHVDGRWDADDDLLAVDRLVHDAECEGDFELVVETARPEEVLLRYQRLLPSRNDASNADAFRTAEARHAVLHDLSLPLVRADLDHARDTWQWVLRLDPHAGLAVQLAALLHDVERLDSEARTRVEHLAPDYQAFKDAHARSGARRVTGLLADLLPASVVERVATLVARHERASDDPEAVLLADADALSFFALNSPGYLAWFGPEATRRKVAWTLGRTSPRARAWLPRLRLPRPVREAIAAA